MGGNQANAHTGKGAAVKSTLGPRGRNETLPLRATNQHGMNQHGTNQQQMHHQQMTNAQHQQQMGAHRQQMTAHGPPPGAHRPPPGGNGPHPAGQPQGKKKPNQR